MFLTKEQVQELSLTECRKHLAEIDAQWDLDRELRLHKRTVWPILDDLVNTILYLEDRIKYIELCDQLDAVRPDKFKKLD